MAREKADREDLFAEATALKRRCELRVPGFVERVLVGFRADGCGSVYFGPDKAYHFNVAAELRRAYRHGQLVKAERGGLVSLRRQRSTVEVALLRHELNGDETVQFLTAMRAQLQALWSAFVAGQVEIERFVGDERELNARILGWLPKLLAAGVAQRPHAG